MTGKRTETIALALCAAFIAACQARSQTSTPEAQLRPVEVAAVEKTDITDVLVYPADLKPYTEVKVFSTVFDRILWFPGKEGDYLQRGERIAVIRKEGLDKGLERLVAEQEALDVQLENLRNELGRSQELLRSGVITQPAYDRLKSNYEATLARKKALEASRGQLAVQAGDAVVRAPIAGVLAGKLLEAGDVASPQLPLCRILDIDKLRAEIGLVEEDAMRVREGMPVRLRLDCCPGRTFEARVSRVWPYLDPASRTQTVEVLLDNPDDGKGKKLLKPGMFGRAEIILGTRPNATVVPEVALVLDPEVLKQQKSGENLRLAFVFEQGKARRRLVKVGSRAGNRLEVLEGLAPGELIIVKGQHGLRDQQPVKAVKGPAAPQGTEAR